MLNLLKRMISLTLDVITVFGLVAQILRLFADFLDAIKNLVQYPEL